MSSISKLKVKGQVQIFPLIFDIYRTH